VFLGKTLSQLSLPRCIKDYTGRFNTGGNPAMDWHPIQWGSRNILSSFMLEKPETMGHLACVQTLVGN